VPAISENKWVKQVKENLHQLERTKMAQSPSQQAAASLPCFGKHSGNVEHYTWKYFKSNKSN
jgi:hypothetical protein